MVIFNLQNRDFPGLTDWLENRLGTVDPGALKSRILFCKKREKIVGHMDSRLTENYIFESVDVVYSRYNMVRELARLV